jgi:hypothetical protein
VKIFLLISYGKSVKEEADFLLILFSYGENDIINEIAHQAIEFLKPDKKFHYFINFMN